MAALAFGRRVGAVDVNVRRVLSRALGGSLDALSTADLQAVADASVPAESPGVWTHALMDVGATFCKPRKPRCGPCPARAECRFASLSGAPSPNPPAAPRSVTDPGRVTAHTARERSAPFATTSRWLRGRILDLLRDAPGETWLGIPATIGSHDLVAIVAALIGLERDGLIERHAERDDMARLPIV